MTSSSGLFSERSIDFNRFSGPYTYAQALMDFGNVTQGWNESRAHITTKQCQIKLCKNSLSASGGMIAKYNIAPGAEYTTTFGLKFHVDFEWCTGGKLGLGFFIGDGAAGGSGHDGQGGSARLVWHKHPRTGEVYLQAYAYHKDQKSRYGECFGRYPAEGSLATDRWYEVTKEGMRKREKTQSPLVSPPPIPRATGCQSGLPASDLAVCQDLNVDRKSQLCSNESDG